MVELDHTVLCQIMIGKEDRYAFWIIIYFSETR